MAVAITPNVKLGVEEIKWSPEAIEIVDKKTGQAAAAFIAGGIGAAALGLVTTIAAASAGFAKNITYVKTVGPLSGKTTLAVAAWLVSWALLAVVFRGRQMAMRTSLSVTGILIAFGFLGTFPLFYDAFVPK